MATFSSSHKTNFKLTLARKRYCEFLTARRLQCRLCIFSDKCCLPENSSQWYWAIYL